MNRKAEFHEPRRSWRSNDSDVRVNYLHMSGRISVASLLAHMATIAPEAKPEEMLLNFGSLVWESASTNEERAEREAQWARQAERQEAWERKTLARLTEKYAATNPTPANPQRDTARETDREGK